MATNAPRETVDILKIKSSEMFHFLSKWQDSAAVKTAAVFL